MTKEDIAIRDPFILVHNNKYYMYGTHRKINVEGKRKKFVTYISEDLENWSEPKTVFEEPEGFWATDTWWAPEIHKYNGRFYMFATFGTDDNRRGTQILVADSPEGPFREHSDGAVTPSDWMCLDGTLYVDKGGIPYIVFCHEWLQVHNGEICYAQLSEDLKECVGEPKLMFTAKDDPESVNLKEWTGGDDYITDGPYLHRCKTGELVMLWATSGKDGYVQAVMQSDNGDIDGNWVKAQPSLFKNDGGHGMIFRDLNGDLKLTLHSPNNSDAHLVLFNIDDTGGVITIK